MAKKFLLTSTNPCILSHSDGNQSDSFLDLLSCASRHATGESNCDGCEHVYTITNNETGRSVSYHALELICPYARRHIWVYDNDGKERTDKFRSSFLVEAAAMLGCTVDELLYPRKDAVVV